MTEPLAVLYEDAHVLAVDKPAGLLTQGRPGGEPTLEDAVRTYLAPGAVYLGTVHRLDRPVSGVVVWAKTPKAARRLSAQFSARQMHKEYWAIVERGADRTSNRSSPASGTTGWRARPTPRGSSGRRRPDDPAARRAITRYQVGAATSRPEGTLWLRLWPETGRTHQLRAQAALRGLPIVGDLAYGASRPFPRGIALHARSLSVPHPVLHETMTWVAPPPEEWAEHGIDLPDFVG